MQGLRPSIIHALSSALPEPLRNLPGEIAGGRARQLIGHVGELRRERAFASERASACLLRLDPWVITSPDLGASVPTYARPIFKELGANRYLWMLGVAGGGAENGTDLLATYFGSAAQWLAITYVESLLTPPDTDIGLNIGANPMTEHFNRQSPHEVRFAWASQMICRAMAEIIKRNPERYPEEMRFDTTTIDEIFAWLALCVSSPNQGRSRMSHLSANARQLLHTTGIPAGSKAGTSFEDLAEDTELGHFPFVTNGSEIAPVALRDSIFSFEIALLHVARRRVADSKMRSELFEEVITEVIRRVAPSDLAPLSPPINIKVLGNANPGEVDFAAISSDGQVLLVGEAKAMSAPSGTHSVIVAFADQVGKALKQLRWRIEALRSGSYLHTAGSIGPTGRFHRLVGVAVPLHSYASAVWNRETLSEVGGVERDLPVIPLHQLALVLRAMEDCQDLLRYFAFRFRIISWNAQVFDELDLLVMYVSPHRDHLESCVAQAHRTGLKPIIEGVAPSAADTVTTRAPASSRQWRAFLRGSVA